MLLSLYNFSLFVIDVFQFLWKSLTLTVERLIQVALKPAKKPLIGEIVLITGAGHGIGKELALEFSRRGAELVLWDINKDTNEQTANEIKKSGGKATAYHCDISDRDNVRRLAQEVLEEIGVVNILVNNAGIMPVQPLTKLNHQQIRRVFEVNALSHFWTIEEFLPLMMEKQHGHIVALSSEAGKQGFPNLTAYCASKYAVTGLMESLSEEIRSLKMNSDIHLTVVFPAVVNTGLAKNPRMKYSWLVPFVDADYVAQKVIDGIQRNDEFVYLPPMVEFFTRIVPLLPRKVHQLMVDTLEFAHDFQD